MRIRFAFSTRLREADWSEVAKKIQTRQAGEQEEPVVVVVDRLHLQENGEDDEVDEHQQHRVRERPDDAQHRALVLRAEVASEEAPEELAVAVEIRVDRHDRGLV